MNQTEQQHLTTFELSPEQELQELQDIYGNGNLLHSSERVMPEQLEASEALAWLGEQVARAKMEGKQTALVAGAFDVPHDNHEWYLRDCKAKVARKILMEKGHPPTPQAIMNLIVNEHVTLIVSIDSDEALDRRKSGKAEKGGIRRPVYPWVARANRIAGYSFEDQTTGRLGHTADIVTRECTINYANTPMKNAYAMASYLKSLDLLDEYIVYDEHPDDEAGARNLGFDPIIIRQDIKYAVDPRTNQEYSSSGIVKKIRGAS